MSFLSVFYIATKEFRYIVFSPIGWVVLAVFAVQVGSAFAFLVDQLFQGLALGSEPRSVARDIYTRSGLGVIARVTDIVYLYIPLLTMATFSRELQSGSIKLLMSSPLRPMEIVLGKFVAVACFLLLFVASIGITLPLAAMFAPSLDIPAAIPGILGVYLLACTFAAIGIFVSSLTNHQIVAAIITLAILFVLGSIAGWFRETPVLNEITNWASLSGRVNDFRLGLVATDNVVYYVAIMCLFLAFTTFRISYLRTRERAFTIVGKVGAVSAVVVSIGWFLSLPQLTAYLDMTYDRRNSLAPESVEIMGRISGPWEIQTYANIFDGQGWLGHPRERIRDRQRFQPYLQHNHQLSMSYDLYYDLSVNERLVERNAGRSEAEVAVEYARRIRLDPESISSSEAAGAAGSIDLATERNRTFRIFRWNGAEARTRFFDDSTRFPQERTRAAALRRLVDGPSRITMLVSNAERKATRGFPTDYRREFSDIAHRWSLVNHGFHISEVTPQEWSAQATDILVVADPREPYSPTSIGKIEDYLERGGDMVLLVERDSTESVDLLLTTLGLARGSELSQAHEEGYADTLILGSAVGGVLTSYFGESSFPVGLDGAVELLQVGDDGGFESMPIVLASEATRNDLSRSNIQNSEPPVVGLALEREVDGEIQRILVFGDADLYSTAVRERRDPILDNGRLDAFHYLTEGRYPVQRTRREAIDVTLNIERGAIDFMHWILVGGLPLSILLTGGWILMMRRRR